MINIKDRNMTDDLHRLITSVHLDTPYDVQLEEDCFNILMTFLHPYIIDAVSDYYIEHTGYSPHVDPWSNKILGIKRLSAYHYKIILAVFPYLGAHNTIGVDYITFSISMNEVKVEGFKHIKGYPVPPWLRID